MRRRKPAFAAQEKTDEELKGYSKLNMELTKGSAVKAVESKVWKINDFNLNFSLWFHYFPPSPKSAWVPLKSEIIFLYDHFRGPLGASTRRWFLDGRRYCRIGAVGKKISKRDDITLGNHSQSNESRSNRSNIYGSENEGIGVSSTR